MANATDAVLARYQAELEEKKIQMDGIIEAAQEEKRDVSPAEMEHYNRCKERMQFLETAMQPLREGAKITAESSRRTAELQEAFAVARNPGLLAQKVEYRSAGEYVVDYAAAQTGSIQAKERMDLYLRAAAHQTSADNLGVIPEPIVSPLLNFIDVSRPMVNAIGVTPMPGGRFNIPSVTQHTDTAKQAGEKAELTSRKMLITRVPVTMDTYGGYVNVSRQDIDWSVPQIMDIVIQDLAGQYAQDCESATGVTLKAGSTAQTPVLTASSTAADVSTAIWKAVGAAYAATPGVSNFLLFVSPDMMGVIGPLFPGVNPTNAQSSGFSAANYGSGVMGTIAGVQVVMSYGLAAGTILLLNAPAARCYEQRIGALQVTEPSVLGVQVAYAGYFQVAALVPTAIIKLTA
jgi:HK97 family phage major capsid protein